ncbi:unnamed protein product [Boreogadus saida]
MNTFSTRGRAEPRLTISNTYAAEEDGGRSLPDAFIRDSSVQAARMQIRYRGIIEPTCGHATVYYSDSLSLSWLKATVTKKCHSGGATVPHGHLHTPPEPPVRP